MLHPSSLVLHMKAQRGYVSWSRAWLIWWQCQDSNPDLIPPLPVLCLNRCHGRGPRSGRLPEKPSESIPFLEGPAAQAAWLWGEGQKSRNREMAEFQGRVGYARLLLLELEAPREPSTWEDPLGTQLMGLEGVKLGLSALSARLPRLDAKGSVESFSCTTSVYPRASPARKIFLMALYLWGKRRLRAGEGLS